jgi:hypothetical protein
VFSCFRVFGCCSKGEAKGRAKNSADGGANESFKNDSGSAVFHVGKSERTGLAKQFAGVFPSFRAFQFGDCGELRVNGCKQSAGFAFVFQFFKAGEEVGGIRHLI